NERLLLVERKLDDKKYAIVYTAILARGGMSPQYREEALDALVKLNKSNAVSELLAALETIDDKERQQLRTALQLARMLLQQPVDLLAAQADELESATQAEGRTLRSAAFAALIAGGRAARASKLSADSIRATLDWLGAVPLVPRAASRAALRGDVVELIDQRRPAAVRRAALRALSFTPNQLDETFRLLAPLMDDEQVRTAAISTLLKIPAKHRDAGVSRTIVEKLVARAESTPAAQRTTDEFVDAMQLADQSLARLPVEQARVFRARLRETTVRVVRIHTVEEEMRYDIPYFAVEAGRPVQIALRNEDLMPHNLVVTAPGALKEVAQLGLAIGPLGGKSKLPYVPDSEKVLHATNMVQPGKQERLTFTAPTEPGEYPFVCTFPRHWMRMYGVMVVVDDLDAWLKNPIKPKDPIGSNRSFVKAWTIDDFKGQIDEGLRGRTTSIGERLFTEATCAQCHKTTGKGGAVGPELTDVFKRWKGDRVAVLREVLDPSHRIDPKYAVHLIQTVEGRVITGIITEEDKTAVTILDNPEAKSPTIVKREEIDEMVKTSKSMMPKALLDRFSQDEIFELLAYLEGLAAATKQ
ncbi:MAG: plastocyanin/azurin family copper-binding protein, partial [Pirellulaceae bacterium]|nr:plastocyanin/azurin family copper-binding protein [Pirellulaceae bacterium]